LKITNRKKELIVLSNGNTVVPLALENQLQTSPYIEQVLLVGDRHPYLTALVVPAFATVAPWAAERGLPLEREVVGLVRHHLICYDDSWSDAAVRRWLRRVSPELAEDLYELGRADALGKGRDPEGDVENIRRLKERAEKLVREGTALSTKDLAISGNDLISELGLRPGPIFKEILGQLLEEVTDDPQRNGRDTLLNRARELSGGRKES
jgi:hypothetical protein